MRRIVGGLLAATAALASLITPAEAAARRDPAVQPFAVSSIWNTPIGRQATYVPAGLRTASVGVAPVVVAATTRADPVLPASASCGGREVRRQRVPAALALPGRSSRTLAVVAPDARTVDAWSSARLCDGSLAGRWAGRTRLDGSGVPVGGRVAGLPGVGGALRGDELTGTVAVRHALALEVPAGFLATGVRWPGVTSSGRISAETAGPALRLGALLALPPTDAAALPVRSDVGRRLVTALRDRGAYVAGVSADDVVRLRADAAATRGYATATGRSFASTDNTVQAELRAVVAALAVVDDNGPASVGGAGARRAALVAPLARVRRAAAPATATVPPTPTPPSAGTASGRTLPSAPVSRTPAPSALLAGIGVLAAGLLAAGLLAGRRASVVTGRAGSRRR